MIEYMHLHDIAPRLASARDAELRYRSEPQCDDHEPPVPSEMEMLEERLMYRLDQLEAYIEDEMRSMACGLSRLRSDNLMMDFNIDIVRRTLQYSV